MFYNYGMDLHTSGIEHLFWKRRIKNYLNGKEAKDAVEAVLDTKCRLGRWIYSVGVKKHGEMLELKELEKVHLEIHKLANKIIGLKNDGNAKKAETESIELDKMSKEVVTKLTALAVRLSA